MGTLTPDDLDTLRRVVDQTGRPEAGIPAANRAELDHTSVGEGHR